MSGVVVELSQHGSGGDSGNTAGNAEVEQYEGLVHLTFQAEAAGGMTRTRSLGPDEARALAAVLVHFAAEVER